MCRFQQAGEMHIFPWPSKDLLDSLSTTKQLNMTAGDAEGLVLLTEQVRDASDSEKYHYEAIMPADNPVEVLKTIKVCTVYLIIPSLKYIYIYRALPNPSTPLTQSHRVQCYLSYLLLRE